MFVTRTVRSRRHVRSPELPLAAVAGGWTVVVEKPLRATRTAFKRDRLELPQAPVYRLAPSLADVPDLNRLPPYRFSKHQHLTANTDALLSVDEYQQPPSEQFSIDAAFQTRTVSRRKALRPVDLNLDPQPIPVPYPSWVPPRAIRSTFEVKNQAVPELDEFPSSPATPSEPGAFVRAVAIRRKPRQGLFLAADGVIEAETLQPLPATLFVRAAEPRRRRRSRFVGQRQPAIDFVDKAPIAGEENPAAWGLPPFVYRRDIKRTLRLPWPMAFEKEAWPGYALARSFFRRATRFTKLDLPLLSFFQPRPFVLPAFQQWPTLRRRSTSFSTSLPRAPEHITLRVPPDSQGFPAFMAPHTAYRVTVRFHNVAIATHVFGLASAALRQGLQPPHYVVGRMSEHGLGVKGALTVHAVTVDGRMAPTHAVDGSFDPSEGHGGSVL